MYKGYTKSATLTKHMTYVKELESASERYYMKEGRWPKVSETPYTSEEVASYAERIYDITGETITLDPAGNYYEIAYDDLAKYTKVPTDRANYILQNPVGRVYYLEDLTEEGDSTLNGKVGEGEFKISQIPLGSIVYDEQSIYNGEIIDWVVSGKNHYNDNNNIGINDHTTLISERLITIKPYDAREAGNPDSGISGWGNSNYELSNIRQWLNSDSMNWYSPTHKYDAPPTKSNVTNSGNTYTGYNAYDTEPGFMTNLSQKFKNSILPTNIVSISTQSGTAILKDKIILPSLTEMTGTGTEGSKFDIFTSASSRVSKPTNGAVLTSTLKVGSINVNTGFNYWVRTYHSSNNVKSIMSDGSVLNHNPIVAIRGIRPVINIDGNTRVVLREDGRYSIK